MINNVLVTPALHLKAYQEKNYISANPVQTFKSSSDLSAQSVAANLLLQTVLLRCQLVIVSFSAWIDLFLRHKVRFSFDHAHFLNQYYYKQLARF